MGFDFMQKYLLMDHEGKDRVGFQCYFLGRGAHTHVNCISLKYTVSPPRYV